MKGVSIVIFLIESEIGFESVLINNTNTHKQDFEVFHKTFIEAKYCRIDLKFSW